MHEDLAGKVAVVTGGGRGLGLEMATALAEQGMAVALLDLLDDVEESAHRLASEAGVATLGHHCDVTDPTSVEAAFTQVADTLGPPAVLVNAAGIAALADAETMPVEDWNRVIGVNLTGTFLTCQAFARSVFAANGRGTIVNVASMSAFVVNIPQHQTAYNVSKAGVDQLTRSLAVEWIERGVRVNAIAPGYFLSDMTRHAVTDDPERGEFWRSRIPAGRLGDPADLRGLVVFLASDASSYVVGESIVIDGGYSII